MRDETSDNPQPVERTLRTFAVFVLIEYRHSKYGLKS
jgi:hypothetical protein